MVNAIAWARELTPAPGTWPGWARKLVTVGLLYHMAAVACRGAGCAPLVLCWSVASPTCSPLTMTWWIRATPTATMPSRRPRP